MGEKFMKKFMPPQPSFATIFDLNGTIVDDAKYQKCAWKILCNRKGRIITDEEYRDHIAGHNQEDVLKYLFGPHISKEEAKAYSREKWMIYKDTFAPVMKEVTGLTSLLEDLHHRDVPNILATSGNQNTIDLILDTLNLRRFFPQIVLATQVAKGKPAPDVFLRAAEILNVKPDSCIVFEDSPAGIIGAKTAKMKCIGIATSLSIKELKEKGVDQAINNFTEICYERLLLIVESSTSDNK